MPKTQHTATFRVGDHVRVKRGVRDSDYHDLPLGGWASTIKNIADDSPPLYLIEWSEETLQNVHPVYRKRCDRDGMDYAEYYLGDEDLEQDTGGPVAIEQPTTIDPRPLSTDDQEDRIRLVFGITSDDPLPANDNGTQRFYFDYLKASLSFPFPAKFRDHVERRERSITVIGMCDTYPIDESYGVMCDTVDGERRGEIPLSELELRRRGPNYQLISDYLCWLVAAPEREFDAEADIDDEWDDGFVDDAVETTFESPPNAIKRQERVGRNDECPCGSGKKYKKCCMRKQV